MKSGKSTKIVISAALATSMFALAACQEETFETYSFQNVEQCYDQAAIDTSFTNEDCDNQFASALLAHDQSAPRYDSVAVCEEVHGEGACQAQTSANGNSVFLPLFMGYMMGGGFDVDKKKRYYGAPLYASKSGGFYSNSGTSFNSLGSKKTVPVSSLSYKAPSTKFSAPMTKTTVRSTGGFGGSRSVSLGG